MITQSPPPSRLLRLARLTEPYRAGGELAAFAAWLPRLRRAPAATAIRYWSSLACWPATSRLRRCDGISATAATNPTAGTWESIEVQMSASSAHCRSGCAHWPRPTDQ